MTRDYLLSSLPPAVFLLLGRVSAKDIPRVGCGSGLRATAQSSLGIRAFWGDASVLIPSVGLGSNRRQSLNCAPGLRPARVEQPSGA